jgi:predicted AlkP superfamily phosphohydrolase/phosphomutase
MSEFIRQREIAACYLMNTEEWDVCMVHFHAIDVLQHALWGFLDPSHSLFRKDMYAEVVRFYQVVDAAIGRIVQTAPQWTLRLVVSDHGFRLHRKVLKLNAWLYQQKLLKTARAMEVKRAVRSHRLLRKGITCLNKLRAPGTSWLLDYRKEHLLDRGRSRAVGTAGPWQSIHGLICINKELPEPKRQECMQAIVTGLSELHDTETGEPIISAVRGTPEIYGPETNQGCPDLIVIPARNYSIDPGFPHDPMLKKITFSNSFHIGTHSTQAICVFDGPEIMRNAPISAHLIDMAPTLIHCLGEPVPSYMQGRVLTEILKENFLRTRPVEHFGDEGESGGCLSDGYSEDEQAAVEQKLQDLGYL